MLVAQSPLTAQESEKIADLFNDPKLSANSLNFYNKALALLIDLGFEKSEIFADWNSKEDNKSDYLRSYLSEMIGGQNTTASAILGNDKIVADLESTLELSQTFPIHTGYISGNKKEILQLSETLYSDGIQQFSSEMFQMALNMNLLTRIETVKKAEIAKDKKPQKAIRIYLDNNGDPVTDPDLAAKIELDAHYALRPMGTMSQEEIAYELFIKREITLAQYQAIANVKPVHQSIKDKLATRSPRGEGESYFVAQNYEELKPIPPKSALHLVCMLLSSEEGYLPSNFEQYNLKYIDQGYAPIKNKEASHYLMAHAKRKGYTIIDKPNNHKGLGLPMDAKTFKLA